MLKKGLLVLIIAAFVAGGAFAQTSFSSMAKNTITVDVGPTILGMAAGMLPNFMPDLKDLNPTGLGFAAQYERQLSKPLSVAGRFSYMNVSAEMKQHESGYTIKTGIAVGSLSAEGHVRFYPFAETFFLSGMVGYANLNGDLSAKPYDSSGTEVNISSFKPVSITPSSSYVKYGIGLGWRISFGRNGGFTFEPSVGYSLVTVIGPTFEKQIKDGFKSYSGTEVDMDMGDIFPMIDQFGVGGPRVSLSFGYRF